jgi:phage baseplate assembly protein W
MSKYLGLFKLSPSINSSEDGFVIYDKEVIKQSIQNLINTHKGSRVYDPDYGTNLHLLIYEPNIQRTRNIAQTEITNVIKKYEPRAELLEVICTAGTGDKAHEVVITTKVKYVEYGDVEEISIRLVSEQTWISEEGTHYNPIQEWFKP